MSRISDSESLQKGDLHSATILTKYATVKCHTSEDNIVVTSMKHHASLSVHMFIRFKTPVLLLMTDSTSIIDCKFI